MSRDSLYYRLRQKKNLRSAWQFVRSSGNKSLSTAIKAEVQQFEEDSELKLDKIQRDLQAGRFVFPPARAIAAKKKGKKGIRPIVLAPIISRIVQRAALNVLKSHPEIRSLTNSKFSFGGVEEGGVAKAIDAVKGEMKNGATWFYRSDIAGFFQKIPRSTVVDIVSGKINDPEFSLFLTKCVDVEIENVAQVKDYLDEFPIKEIGVAQGCCLSPLLGNIFLSEFDKLMNSNGLKTIRYIDDLIILSDSKRNVDNGFFQAQNFLAPFGMKLYEHKTSPEKAAYGRTENRFEFLGCEFLAGKIRANEKSRKRFFSKIQKHFTDSLRFIKDGKTGFGTVIWKASHIINGWAKHYTFCDDIQYMADIDRKLDSELQTFMNNFKWICKDKDGQTLRKYVGLAFAIENKKG